MKKIVISLFLALFAVVLSAQEQAQSGVIAKQQIVNDNFVYRLFHTGETVDPDVFIKLNTRNGQMWQVEYTLSNDYSRVETVLNGNPLIDKEEEENGRSILYPTQNTWTFMSLDQVGGG